MFDKIDPKKYRVALLAGGKSNESDISKKSAVGAKGALEEAGFQVTQLDPADKADLVKLINGDFDVAFLALHGKGGEDGTLQGFLELIDLPYTGSGVWSSATSIHKGRSKHFYECKGIPTPKNLTLTRKKRLSASEIINALGSKVVVKAATEGSSIGVYIVEGEEAIEDAVNQALELDDNVLVEAYIPGKEYTVAVVEIDGEAQALPIIEIIPKADSYDFESKYAIGGSEHICPANLPEDVAAKMQEYAVQAHNCLNCKTVSRNDFIIDNNGNMWILETNTIPGMTPTSLLPDAAKAAGIPFAELCTIMVENALNK